MTGEGQPNAQPAKNTGRCIIVIPKTLVIRPDWATIGQGFQMSMTMTMNRNLVRGLAMLAVALATVLWSGCAMRTLQAAAERGDAKAQAELGCEYFLGQGVKQDYVEAIKWLRKAAAQGRSDAMCFLGRAYQEGYGVKRDYVEAVNWFRKGAERGNVPAQFNLANCYYNGQGVPQGFVEAYTWATLAGAAGERNSIALCNDCIIHLTPDQIVEGQKRAAAFVPKKTSP